MTPSLIAWILAGAAILIAGWLFSQRTQMQAACDALQRELDEQTEQIGVLQKRLAQREKDQAKRTEELASLRIKLEKAKKRGDQKDRDRQGVSSQIQELEATLARERSNYAELQSEFRQTQEKLQRMSGEPVKKTPEPPKPDPTEALRAVTLGRELAEKIHQLTEAEQKLQRLDQELASAKQEVRRQKNKRETLDKAYAMLRGELEVRKDEVRAQRSQIERLLALKVALTDDVEGSTSPNDLDDPADSDHDDLDDPADSDHDDLDDPTLHDEESPAALKST